MIRDIIGEWDLTLIEKGRETPAGRILFAERDGRVVVMDADPEAATRPARVDIDGDVMRFELLSAGSSRGSAHHFFEVRQLEADALVGTRRRGMLAKTQLTGHRVELSALEPADAAALLALAEAEVAVALEAARRAAERAAAARAAVPSAGSTMQPTVAPVVLAALPAPTAPPAQPAVTPAPVPEARPEPVPEAVSEPTPEAGPVPTVPVLAQELNDRTLRISHRLTRGEIVVLAAEIFPDVYVWGTFAAAGPRLREAGWALDEVATDETIHVDDALLQHAFAVGQSVAS